MRLDNSLASLINKTALKTAAVVEVVRRNTTSDDGVVFVDGSCKHSEVNKIPVFTDDKTTATKLASKGLDVKTFEGRVPEQVWVYIKKSALTLADVGKPIAQVMNLAPASWNKPLGEMGTSPLVSMITSGLLGGGLGYAGGALAEKVVPEEYMERGRLRKTTAILGALLGAAPGAYLGTVGMANNSNNGKDMLPAWTESNHLFGKSADNLKEQYKDNDIIKEAFELGDSGLFNVQPIAVDMFNRAIMADPYAPMGIQAATVGLVEAANQSKGNTGLINPFDIARIGMGMGAGLTQAYLGGKVLGALAGLTPKAQQTLQQTGMYAGALKAVVPGLFGQ